MLKSEKVIPITPVKAKMKCGDCLHFKHVAKFERPCNTLGVKHFADAPTCFDPNVYELQEVNPDVLFQMAVLMRQFNPKQTRVFLGLMRQKLTMEKNYDLSFGQPVMFRIGGGDYLSNYFRGYVLGVCSVGDSQVYVTSDMGKTQRKKPAVATLMPSSVFTISQWKKKQCQLIKENKLKDPNPLYSAKVDKKDLTIDYQVPSLEDAPAAWFDKTDKGNGTMNSKKRLKKGNDGTLSFKVDRE